MSDDIPTNSFWDDSMEKEKKKPLLSRKKHPVWKADPLFWALCLGGVFIAVIMTMELQKNSVYFLTPSEAKVRAASLQNQTIRVGGMVEVGTLQRVENSLKTKFVLSNLKDVRMEVSYVGLLPDMFKEGSGVVLEGDISASGERFRAQKLMVKHSEEYVRPDIHNTQEVELLKDSLLREK